MINDIETDMKELLRMNAYSIDVMIKSHQLYLSNDDLIPGGLPRPPVLEAYW